MKKFTFLWIVCVCVLLRAGASDASGFRNWTNTEGKVLSAQMISATADSVTVRIANGQTFVLPLGQLSEADQTFVREQSAPKAPSASAAAKPKDGWWEDFEQAKSASTASGTPILMLFTGSDWCGYCINLEKNVLGKSEFKKMSEEKLTLMMVDMPRRKSQSSSLKKANQALVTEYKIRGYPTLLLVDKDGKEQSRFGYGGQDAKGFVKMLEEKIAGK